MFRRYLLAASLSFVVLAVALLLIHPQADAGPTGSQIEIIGGSATPEKAAPPDVMTFRVGLGNSARRIENLEVQIKVIGPQGNEVLQTTQSGVSVSDNSTQAVYWVWRIPAELVEGNYSLQTSVIDKDRNRVLVADKDIASFELTRTGFHLN